MWHRISSTGVASQFVLNGVGTQVFERNSPVSLDGQTPLSADAATPATKDSPDVLSKQKCLDALAALRHAKWFQVGITHFSCSPTLCSLASTSLKAKF